MSGLKIPDGRSIKPQLSLWRHDHVKSVGIFGGSGFIGRHLVRRLSALGIDVVAFGRNFPSSYEAEVGHAVETRNIDIQNLLEAHACLQGISTVVQLINNSSPALGNSHTLTDIEQNVTPQVGFIENCILAGVKNFIFISSGGTIYGPPATLPIPEDHPANPINSYGMTKLVVEKYLRMLTRDTEMAYTILRVANPFGPGQHSTKGQGLIPSVLKSHFRGQPTTIYGDGSNLRDYLYIDDLIEALCAALAAPAVFGPLNIGSGVGRSVMEVVEAVGTALGTSIELRFLPDRPTDLKVNVLDISRAREFLSWEPRMPFADGVAMTVSAFLTENVA